MSRPVDHSTSPVSSFLIPAPTASVRGSMILTVFMMMIAAAATGLAAQVRLPMPGSSVPFTLQTVAVLLTGFFLRPLASAGAMVLYLAVGTLGIFPFAASTGLWGHTGGYLVGFLIAAPLVSLLSSGRSISLVRLALAATAGMSIIFALGVTWKAALSGWNFPAAVADGFLPFVPEAVLKTALVVAFVRALSWTGFGGKVPARVGTAAPKDRR